MKPVFKTGAGGDLSRVRHRGVGGGAGQHAVAGRPGADVRDRPVRQPLAQLASGLGSDGRVHPRRLAPRRRPRSDRSTTARRTGRMQSRPSASSTTRPRPGVTSRIAEVRRRSTAAGHPALFMVDTISSLASIDYRQDEWGVDVTVAGSQKGLMLPPGLSLQRASARRRWRPQRTARLPRSYWDWGDDAGGQPGRLLPLHARHQPALRPARGDRHAGRGGGAADNVFARHDRHGEATTRARSRPGAWRSCAPIRASTAARSPPCWCRRGTTRTSCGA